MKLSLYTYTKTLITLITFIVLILTTSMSAIFSLNAASVENDQNSFIYYKQKTESALQDMEREFRLNNAVTDSTISNIRTLVQEAYLRLPDTGDVGSKNE